MAPPEGSMALAPPQTAPRRSAGPGDRDGVPDRAPGAGVRGAASVPGMSQADTPRRAHGLLTLPAADALWPELLSNSTVPAAPEAFTSSPADPRSGYILLGSHLVPTVQDADDHWHVHEADVRRAAAELRSVTVNRNALVHVAPGRVPSASQEDTRALRWRQRLDRE